MSRTSAAVTRRVYVPGVRAGKVQTADLAPPGGTAPSVVGTAPAGPVSVSAPAVGMASSLNPRSNRVRPAHGRTIRLKPFRSAAPAVPHRARTALRVGATGSVIVKWTVPVAAAPRES